MDIESKEIRKSARYSLKGNWKIGILSTLVYSCAGIIGGLFQDSSVIWNLILEIIFGALFTFGYFSIILNIVRGENVNFSDIFTGTKKFTKALGMTLAVNILTLLWSLLLIIPGIIAAVKYSMTYYIWADNPNISIQEAIDRSIKMTDGHISEIFWLYISFIGWSLLVIAPAAAIKYWHPEYFDVFMSFGMIFVNVYVNVSFGSLYTKLLQEGQRDLEAY
ncbi:DUF975 family protein [Candidatus Clostridium helianthi]|uniref:DUF975 family protein n=1 Tax=Candidatus Clostridium helianthi TaxID=3381660 RepID=A0ABW8S4P9_9CLOT